MSRIVTLSKRIWNKRHLISTDKIKKMSGYFWYNENYDRLPIKTKTILFESRQGADLQGNVFYLLKTAVKEYPDYAIYLSVNKKARKHVARILENYNLCNINLVPTGSKAYYRELATAKYLITDVTFPTNFIRRPEQVYLNTWHGVPLKAMGRQSKDARMTMGNIQRNFMQASILLHPNKYTSDVMNKGYAIDTLAINAKNIIQMYPRDEIFTTQTERFAKTEDEKVYAYLPTWREHPTQPIEDVLNEIDTYCPKNITIYAKLHPLDTGRINWDRFTNVKQAPNGYELNDMLSRCDGLITDYSSVLFDYAYSGKPIVLYQYDKKEYMANRGLNIDVPLPTTTTPQSIFNLMSSCENTTELLKDYCPVIENTTKILLEKVISYQQTEDVLPYNLAQNAVVMYAGNLNKNGITTAGISLANELVKKGTVVFTTPMTKAKENNYALDRLSDAVIYYPLPDAFLGFGSLWDFIGNTLYLFKGKGFERVKNFFNKKADQINTNLFKGLKFKTAIQYTGYEYDRLLEFVNIPAQRNMVFTHNDMDSEVNKKGTLQKETLEYVYGKYDDIVLVSEEIRKSTEIFAKENRGKIKVLPNLIDLDYLQTKGKERIKFQEKTVCRMSESEYNWFLHKHDYNIVSIGRFSKEKRHDKLIESFTIAQGLTEQKLSLTLIGGYGEEFFKTVELSKNNPDIVVIKSIDNPQPIIKKSDCMILVSDYEAQPLVLFEGKIQGCQLITTDIPTSKAVIDYLGGYLTSAEPEDIARTIINVMKSPKSSETGLENLIEYNKQVAKEIEDAVFRV